MSDGRTAVIIGGTSGIGRELARLLAGRGESVVITGRDETRAKSVAAEIGVQGLALDLARPAEIAARLSSIERVDHLVIAAIQRDENSVRTYDIERATQLATLKLVGYTEATHVLFPRMTKDASIVLFGGLAKERPYPGSTSVTTVNGAISSLTLSLAVELGPIRVNAIHPGIVGDSPAWSGKPPEVLERIRSRTPTGRLPTMADVASAVLFLLDNGSVNAINLNVDGGWLAL
jgi:NAD(P)-dependent dehydrogenase (short-subunit alcohol dehydrogenase family)